VDQEKKKKRRRRIFVDLTELRRQNGDLRAQDPLVRKNR